MTLTLLPTELIVHILQFCSAKDVTNISTVNRRLREISSSEKIWKTLCLKDYGIENRGEDFDSFEELYKYFLHRYGHLLGTYMLGLPTLGGLAEIVFQGSLMVWHWQQDPSPRKPIKKLLLFKIGKGAERGSANVVCCTTDETHEGHLRKAKSGRRFVLQCARANEHHHDTYIRELVNMYRENREDMPNVLIFEAVYRSTLIEGIEFFPLKIPDRKDIPENLFDNDGALPESLVEPGLFRCVYNYRSSTGLLSYKSFFIVAYKSQDKLTLFKVSQDAFQRPEHNAKILLYKALVPKEDFDQEYFHPVLPMVPKGQYENHHPKLLQEQDFPIYSTELQEYESLRAGKCKARFCGFVPITSSRAEQINFIVFDNDLVATLWMTTGEFNVYARETKTFTKKRGPRIYVNK